MPFQVSPGVNVSEIDLTTVVPAVSTTEGAIAGVFRWGPVDTRVLVDSEATLASRFGKPTNHNAETFFTAANFLSYGNKLYVVRTANTTDAAGSAGVLTAYANVASVTTNTNLIVKNDDMIDDSTVISNIASETGVRWIARYPGAIGNSLKISVCDTNTTFFSNTSLTGGDANLSANGELTCVVATTGSNTITIKIANSSSGNVAEAATRANTIYNLISTGDLIEIGNTTIGTQKLKVGSLTNPSSNSTHGYFTITTTSKYTLGNFGNLAVANVLTNDSGYLKRHWEYSTSVDKAPGTSTYQSTFGNTAVVDEVHVVVADEDGLVTGVPGSVLEVFEGVSRATDAKTEDGTSNYYKTVIDQNSNFVYLGTVRGSNYANTAANIVNLSNNQPQTLSFVGGSDGADEANVTIGELQAGYDFFKSAEDVDVSLVLQGKARGGTNGEGLANYIIDNICEVRKDCVAFVSPDKSDVVLNSGQDEADDVVAYRNSLTSTSYAVLDSGYKYQYDKYNDVYRYVPLNGDMAGLCVRTDDVRDPWFSPAGFNRGIIKNTVKLAFNPNKAQRDILYKNGVNPVVTFPGQGTLLFGDKTLLAKPSAFDRINVRRLFIVLEKAIATAAQFSLFEFNDEFTRSQFVNLVEPFLRDVQGRRGITDFRVVCDESNNTGEVIDRNEFVGDIYIKPARSINYIQLNFVAVRTGVEFSEVVGQF
jgi:phage tail sheath protein FI